ncbi:MAG: UbiX family flavin prenyltransferase [Armatimonadetes bacterium]|nr:UbiX family flavin prenyltransferase [Armatimonadota bacterium]
MTGQERRLVVAITGASGSIYAVRFLEAALEHYDRIYLTMTENAAGIMRAEYEEDIPPSEKIEVLAQNDLSAPPSSGSVLHEGMVIIPCSMGTVGRIAAGISNDLVTRAADVCLKERRPLILIIRETPLNLIHLRNLTALTELSRRSASCSK